MTGFSFELASTLGVVPNARVLIPLTGTLGITAAGNGTALDDLGGAPAVPTLKGIGAAIHIINKGGSAGNITLRVQHSPDNSVWTDIIVFAAKTLIHQYEYLEAPGTVNRYLRAIWTLTAGTSWDVSVVAGRK